MLLKEIQNLSDENAIEALTIIAKKWISSRGVEFYQSYFEALSRSTNSSKPFLSWFTNKADSTPGASDYARHLLTFLIDSRDEDVREWTHGAIHDVLDPEVQLEPATLTIGGVILIAAILATRVKKIDRNGIEFYEGLDDTLGDILKNVSVMPLPS